MTTAEPEMAQERLLQQLGDPRSDIRLQAIATLGSRGNADAAAALVECALRYPADTIAAVEVIRSLCRLPRGLFRRAALRTLHEQHPEATVRRAAARALADG